ncbi:MAG: hypothetical protein ACRDJH_24605 [Thermomicrobiales bacterium]
MNSVHLPRSRGLLPVLLIGMAILAVATLAVSSSSYVRAQDYDYGPSTEHAEHPAATNLQSDVESHPAHIHTDPCATIGGIEFPLHNVGPDWLTEGTPVAGETVGLPSAFPVQASVTTIDATLDDLLNGPRALNVHESDANIQNYIACGDLGGKRVDDTLVIGLQELNDTGYSGVAVLQGNGDTTTVSVYVIREAEDGGA